MVMEREPVSQEAFNEFVQRVENTDHLFELIDGEIEEKPVVAHPVTGVIAGRISYYLNAFIIPRDLGYTTGADTGFKVANNRLIPDVALVSKQRFDPEAVSGYHPTTPDLAIEVISPTDTMKKVIRKVALYLEADIPVWLVNPNQQTIMVYEPDGDIVTYQFNDTLVGTGILQGFMLVLSEVFVV